MNTESGMNVPVSSGAAKAEQHRADLVEFDLRALTHFQADRIGVTVLSDIGSARVVLFAFEAGQELKEHETSSQILVQVVRGRIDFTAAGQTITARTGTLLQLEAGVRHSIVARSRAAVLVTMTPSPVHHSLEHDVFEHLTPLVERTTEAS